MSELNLNEQDLNGLLAYINDKLHASAEEQFSQDLACLASFTMKLFASIIIGVAPNREEAMQGIKEAYADSAALINKAYDALDAIKAAADGKVH
jgi:hypothetical protein